MRIILASGCVSLLVGVAGLGAKVVRPSPLHTGRDMSRPPWPGRLSMSLVDHGQEGKVKIASNVVANVGLHRMFILES